MTRNIDIRHHYSSKDEGKLVGTVEVLFEVTLRERASTAIISSSAEAPRPGRTTDRQRYDEEKYRLPSLGARDSREIVSPCLRVLGIEKTATRGYSVSFFVALPLDSTLCHGPTPAHTPAQPPMKDISTFGRST